MKSILNQLKPKSEANIRIRRSYYPRASPEVSTSSSLDCLYIKSPRSRVFAPVKSFEDIVGTLFVGDYPSSMDVSLLQKHQIHAILALGDDCPPNGYPMIKGGYKVIAAVDSEPADFLKCFDSASQFIQRFMTEGNVLIYCYSGASRSAAVAIGYLMVTVNLPFEVALAQVSKAVGGCELSSYHVQQLRRIERKRDKGMYSSMRVK